MVVPDPPRKGQFLRVTNLGRYTQSYLQGAADACNTVVCCKHTVVTVGHQGIHGFSPEEEKESFYGVKDLQKRNSLRF